MCVLKDGPETYMKLRGHMVLLLMYHKLTEGHMLFLHTD